MNVKYSKDSINYCYMFCNRRVYKNLIKLEGRDTSGTLVHQVALGNISKKPGKYFEKSVLD